MNVRSNIGLNGGEFASAFPFHLALDERLRVEQVGPSLARILPELAPGRPFYDVLQIERPSCTLTAEALRENLHLLFIVRGPHDLMLRGQLVARAQGGLLFLLSPWVTQVARLKALGLSLDDYALHDATADLLQVVQSHLRALEDSRTLNETVTRQRAELRETKATAEQASRAKGEFLATMSHEIRTPMNGVLGLLQLLQVSQLDPERQDLVETALRSGESLLAILNGILDFSKIEAGRLDVESVPFELPVLFEDCRELLENRAVESGVDLRLQLAPGLPNTAVGDPTRLRQVLINLMGNAIKFTPGGAVTVRARIEEETAGWRLLVEVEDSGIGIPADTLPLLFHKFSQADTSTTRKFGGTGLGLAICRQLVELMQGRIEARSETGRGSVFAFELPLGMAEVSRVIDIRSLRTTSGAEASDHDELHVLVVDDNPVNLKVASRMLQHLGCRVVLAETGLEALERWEEHRHSLVFLDCMMPEMDGYEAARRLCAREAALNTKIHIVALTANASPDDHARCIESGMQEVLTKPLRLEELKRVLREHRARERRAA